MEFYYSAPNWDDEKCPHTCEEAKPTGWTSVANATVIRITNGSYREAIFSGHFVLDESTPITTNNNGENEAIFFCCWFGHRLQTRGIKIKFNPSNAETIKGYSGEVVSNLSI
jgi:hypothetical protein